MNVYCKIQLFFTAQAIFHNLQLNLNEVNGLGTRKAENQKGRRPKRPLTKKALPKRPQP